MTSPGGLYNGLTYEAMMNGRSSIRNRAIANVFSQMGLVESWGTGIKRIIAVAKEYGLRDPEFIEFDDMFRVNFYRNISPNHVGENVGENVGEPKDIQGRTLPITLNDPRWPASEGWVKMEQIVPTSKGKICIHYVYNSIIDVFDDFKIK